MIRFSKHQSVAEFQAFITEVYGLPDDRLYSISDLLVHVQRFAMRALKGIRKGDAKKLKLNLLISVSWLMAIANRLRINAEEELWGRFPMVCSYCGKRPCACKKIRPSKRRNITTDDSKKPKNLSGFQTMFNAIYPPSRRTLPDAGVHLSEEIGELGEAIHTFSGRHEKKQFDDIKFEIADSLSCLFGVANSARIDVARELGKMYYKGCHVCHAAPCRCSFSTVANIET